MVLPLLSVALAFAVASCGSDEDAAPATTGAAATTVESAAAPTTAVATTVAETAAPGTDAATTVAGGDAATEGTVDISDFKFLPDTISIAVGGTLTFTNSDAQAHTATASGNFDTGSIAAGATADVTYDTAGSFAYICSFHPFMKGTVEVG